MSGEGRESVGFGLGIDVDRLVSMNRLERVDISHPGGNLRPMQFDNVSASALANVYFDGKVVSHSLTKTDGEKVTLGLIYPGEFHFATEAAERMDITGGACLVTLDGSEEARKYDAGTYFEVSANSGFTIQVSEGICQYICTFLS